MSTELISHTVDRLCAEIKDLTSGVGSHALATLHFLLLLRGAPF